jgi:hypothetical protein
LNVDIQCDGVVAYSKHYCSTDAASKTEKHLVEVR